MDMQEIEKRLDAIEKKLAEHDQYIKSDIKEAILERDKLEEIEDEVNFIDEKLEHRK